MHCGKFVSMEEYRVPVMYYIKITTFRAAFGRFHIKLILVCGLCTMGIGMENSLVGFVLTQVKCDMVMTSVEQGLLNSIVFVGIVVSSHFWGFLADTWGRQKVMRAALCGGAIFAYISALSTTVTCLILTRLMVGIL